MVEQWPAKLSLLKFKFSYPTHSLNFIRLLRVVITPSVERRKRLEAIGWISGYPTHPPHRFFRYLFLQEVIITLEFTQLYLLVVEPWSTKLSLLTFKSTHPTPRPTDSFVTYFSRSFITTLGFTRLYLLVVWPWSAKYVDQSSFNSKSINWLATEKKNKPFIITTRAQVY